MSEQAKPEGFDLQTHGFDPKTKQLAWKNPYRLWKIKGRDFYERPVGSGNLWTKAGEPSGRILDFQNTVVDAKAEHVAYVPPKSQAELEYLKVHEMSQRNKELEAELSAIKKEKSYEVAEKKAAAMKDAEKVIVEQTKKAKAAKG